MAFECLRIERKWIGIIYPGNETLEVEKYNFMYLNIAT